jgi:hypothetical protein
MKINEKIDEYLVNEGKDGGSLKLAKLFHETYESLAPKYGYETREDTKKFKPNSPNGKLMIAVSKELLKQLKFRESKDG